MSILQKWQTAQAFVQAIATITVGMILLHEDRVGISAHVPVSQQPTAFTSSVPAADESKRDQFL